MTWYKRVPMEGITFNEPGIYDWQIVYLDGPRGSYVGKYSNDDRPIDRYVTNVERLRSGGRPLNGKNFRPIHRDLVEAIRSGLEIEVRIVENCRTCDLDDREDHWKRERLRQGLRRL